MMQFKKTLEMLGLYINSKLDRQEDLTSLYKDLQQPSITFEVDSDEEEIPAEYKAEYSKLVVKEYREQKSMLKDNLRKVHTVVWAQCSQAMRASLMGMEEFESRNRCCKQFVQSATILMNRST